MKTPKDDYSSNIASDCIMAIMVRILPEFNGCLEIVRKSGYRAGYKAGYAAGYKGGFKRCLFEKANENDKLLARMASVPLSSIQTTSTSKKKRHKPK